MRDKPIDRKALAAALSGVRKQVEWNGWDEPFVTERFLQDYVAVLNGAETDTIPRKQTSPPVNETGHK